MNKSLLGIRRSLDSAEMITFIRFLIVGGINTLFGDGHVSFISETVDTTIWGWLGSINDGNPIPLKY